jgi:hypothetical protein
MNFDTPVCVNELHVQADQFACCCCDAIIREWKVANWDLYKSEQANCSVW